MSVWIAATSPASGRGGRPRRRGAVLCRDERCGRETPRAAATALTGRPPATRSRARAAFWGRSRAPLPRAGSRSRASSCRAGAAAHGSADGPHAARRPEPPPRRRRRRRALRHQPAPGEELVARDAMTPRHERDRVAGQIRLFDDPHLLLRRPAAPPLHRRDHLDPFGAGRAFVESSHRVRHTTHTY
jgi:hypothetical protein